VDMIEKRKVSLNNNILRKEQIDINDVTHSLILKREGRFYVIALLDSNETQVDSKTFLTKFFSSLHFRRLIRKHSISEKLLTPQEAFKTQKVAQKP